MSEDETFNEFYTRISDLRNLMVSLRKKVSDAKLIKKILRYFPERFRIKVTTIEESKDLNDMKIFEELMGSLQTYEFPYPQSRRQRQLLSRLPRRKAESHLMKTLMIKRMQLLCLPRILVN
jgi:hypothetical protein